MHLTAYTGLFLKSFFLVCGAAEEKSWITFLMRCGKRTVGISGLGWTVTSLDPPGVLVVQRMQGFDVKNIPEA